LLAVTGNCNDQKWGVVRTMGFNLPCVWSINSQKVGSQYLF
jgi:hypothetical protein